MSVHDRLAKISSENPKLSFEEAVRQAQAEEDAAAKRKKPAAKKPKK